MIPRILPRGQHAMLTTSAGDVTRYYPLTPSLLDGREDWGKQKW
jgi:hypothetical protein